MRPTLFGAWPSIAEEPEIAPSFLLGMTGCPWRCAFCNVAHRRDAALLTLDREALSHLAAVALDLGARTLQLTGGEPLLHAAALSRLLSRPLPLPVVLNTALALPVFPRQALWSRLDRVIASVKFGSDACASRLAGVTAYSARTRARLLALKRRGVPLLLRHLLMPGHLDCCTVPVLRWAERGLPGVPLTLLSGYIPPSRSPHAPELARCLAPHELERAHALAAAAGTDVRVAGEYDGASRSQGVCPAGSRPGPVSDIEIIVDASGGICFAGFHPACEALVRGAGLAPGKQRDR